MASTRAQWLVLAVSAIAASGCSRSSGPGGEGAGGGAGRACTNCTPTGAMTFRLPSPAGATVWTTTVMDKALREAAPPDSAGEAITLFAARNEFEPFQVVVRADSSGSAILTMTSFTGPGAAALDRIEVRRVGYVRIGQASDASSIPSGQVPDPLEPMAFGSAQSLPAAQNQPFWITVHVPASAPAGDYTAALTVKLGAASQDIPVRLHVFDFALPAAIGFDGNWNTSFQALGGSESLEAVRRLKDFFFEHRLVPSSVAWPAGLNYPGGIEYDCASGQFIAEDNAYDFSRLGPEYIDGEGWNEVGFPSFEIMQFVNNSTPRPENFCGVDRGSGQAGTSEYNAKWSEFLGAIDAYLIARGWQGKGYYYVQNEPQDEADYEIAAYLADLTKSAAPHLRIAISEEPKPDIVDRLSDGGHSYDLWWANLSAFDPIYAAVRQGLGEEVWWYFLYGDRPPHFNPTTIDHPGIETRVAFWAAWKYRLRGFAYYSVTGWGSDPYQNPRPQGTDQNGDGFLLYPPKDGQLVTSIRWELLREGVEDFEYLLLAAGGQLPATPAVAAGCDASVASAVSSTTAFTRDASALQHLRNQLGSMLEGRVDGCPLLDSEPAGAHARAAYYINFQDPDGEPLQSPLVVDGHEWLKIGWEPYDAHRGYGWSGENIGDTSIMKYQYLGDAPVSELQRSVIYDDWGRSDTFNWDIENGRYRVTASIGWYDRGDAHQRVVVEGQTLFDFQATTPAEPYEVLPAVVEVSDGNVTLEIGGKCETTNANCGDSEDWEYTMLDWMSIEPAE